MLSLLAAALMQPASAAPPADSDLRCMAAYLFAVGQMPDDPDATEEDKSAATAIVMYFFGKVRGSTPASDVKADIRRLVEAPGYLEDQLRPDLERCGEEFNERARELEAFGSD